MAAPDNGDPLLRVRGLRLSFHGHGGAQEVLHGVDLHVRRGERVALVGESGSGKSVTARLILGLLQRQRATRYDGSIRFEGREIIGLSHHAHQALRGRRVSMIFQDPTSALNPVFPIQTQYLEVLRRVEPRISRRTAAGRAVAALKSVSIEDPERVLRSYPFQLSGGMNQRVMINLALINNPALLIADEPGTALDVTVQDQTLRLMRRLAEQRGASVLLISHNLGVVREFAERIYVMHRGRIVEQARAADLFADPRHPYTKTLLAAAPRLSGGGVAALADLAEAAFDTPRMVHAGAEEPT